MSFAEQKPTCDHRICPNNCGGVGFCSAKLNYQCICPRGHSGKDCSEKQCPEKCEVPYARCFDGKCLCAAGWTGPDCMTAQCDKGCSGHGVCELGGCKCDNGWSGQSCNVKAARNALELVARRCAHGVYVNSTCYCNPGWSGTGCEARTCLCQNGLCQDGICLCAPGYGGVDCATPTGAKPVHVGRVVPCGRPGASC